MDSKLSEIIMAKEIGKGKGKGFGKENEIFRTFIYEIKIKWIWKVTSYM